MSAKRVDCWTIICDLCGFDASDGTEYSGTGPGPQEARDQFCNDVWAWFTVDDIDICADHAEWSHDDDPDHRPCQSCGEYPRDEVLFAANCPDCWKAALRWES